MGNEKEINDLRSDIEELKEGMNYLGIQTVETLSIMLNAQQEALSLLFNLVQDHHGQIKELIRRKIKNLESPVETLETQMRKNLWQELLNSIQ